MTPLDKPLRRELDVDVESARATIEHAASRVEGPDGSAAAALAGLRALRVAADVTRTYAADTPDAQPFADYRGKYVYLLVTQTPNKPVWTLEAGEVIQWQAVTLDGALLAFSSLPKAVGFMQPAVLAGRIHDVNKVGKFSVATARTWTQPVLLNPASDVLENGTVGRIEVDATTAEAPDE